MCHSVNPVDGKHVLHGTKAKGREREREKEEESIRVSGRQGLKLIRGARRSGIPERSDDLRGEKSVNRGAG